MAACRALRQKEDLRYRGTTEAYGNVKQVVTRLCLLASRPGLRLKIGTALSAAVFVALLVLPSDSIAQGKKKTKTRKSEPTLVERVAKAKTEVIAAANDYKTSLQKLLALQEDDVKKAAETVERRKELLAQAVISKKELEEGERALSAAQDKVRDTNKQIGEADNLIAEATAEEKLAKLGPGAYVATAALIRYNGPTRWVLTDAAKVQSFFALRFNHALPISAYGQTAVHNQLGFDHHNSIDVAVSPDSREGQTLMAYLRGAGIPFIAFRYAVRGSATGAHIHIGYPSHRLAK